MLRIAAGAMVALLVGGAAVAQTPGPRCPSGSQPQKARKEFVENYSAAQHALSEKRYSDAVATADVAAAFAADDRQLQAVLQIKAASYFGMGDRTSLAANIAAAQSLGCLSEAQLEQIRRMQSTQ
jgi:hypothetical protein